MSGVDRLLSSARAGLARLTPQQAHDAAKGGALLVDTRTAAQRARQGEVPGAIVIDRTVLEWRIDPTCPRRIPEAVPGRQVIVLCRQGYSSSLAAASLPGCRRDRRHRGRRGVGRCGTAPRRRTRRRARVTRPLGCPAD